MSDLTRAIQVRTRHGVKRIHGVPNNAKITFGPVNPGGKYHDGTNALRIYVGTNQLAVFLDVVEFRDLSLRVLEQKTISKDKRKLTTGPNGSSDEMVGETSVEWEEVQ